MTTWQSIQTRGFIKVTSLILMTSVTTMGSSIASPIPPLANPTSAESILLRKENPKEENEKLPQSQTGSDIMEALTILNEILEKLEKTLSEEKSSPSTKPLEK